MRWYRISIRRMMVAVAVLALVLTAVVLGRRSAAFQRRAETHHRLHLSHEGAAEAAWQDPQTLAAGDSAQRQSRLALYHAKMSQKYWLAACRPWRSVPADPPLP